ncbi:hypothetical protein [Leptospira santarosai]|uniref:hypothetical protein n=1 Tax=Leptospira santarosai TaxID=28183 RepID=UPI0005195ABD|nr:hypothetical protein [Leptospira santarosai]
MKYRMIMIAMLVSTSLYSVENENTWTLWNSGIENKCKNVLETKQKEGIDISPNGLKKKHIECKNGKLQKFAELEDVNTMYCKDDSVYFFMANEERCIQFKHYLSISSKTWYAMIYSLDKKDSPARCISTADPAVEKFFGPSNYVFKEGCKVAIYEPNAGLLSIDCSKNKTFSSMPTLFYADSEALCLNIKETYE